LNSLTHTYTSDAANEYTQLVTSSVTQGYVYDARGNLSRDDGLDDSSGSDYLQYYYDLDNRLTKVDYDAGTLVSVAEYRYDTSGRRIEYIDHVRDVTTQYYYDGPKVVAEYEYTSVGGQTRLRTYMNGSRYIDERAVMRDYVYGEIVEDEPIPQDHYYLQEELYSVAGLAASNGHLEEAYVYDTYGQAVIYAWPVGDYDRDGEVTTSDQNAIAALDEEWEPLGDINIDGVVDEDDLNVGTLAQTAEAITYSALDNPFMFTGRLTDTINDLDVYYVVNDATGFRRLQDNRTRTYDPKHGRWLQRDAMGYIDGMNLYEYVGSRPTNRVDPFATYGSDVHYHMNYNWARDEGMTVAGAMMVGVYNIGTDDAFGSTTWLPRPWDPTGQGYHFNSSREGEEDSRKQHQREDLQEAKDACVNADDPFEAAHWLGRSLHALQDWWAHGDFAKSTVTLMHHGPYYDDINMDAYGPVYRVAMPPQSPYYHYDMREPECPYPSYECYPYYAVDRPDPSGTTPVEVLPRGRPNQVFGKRTERREVLRPGNWETFEYYWEARWPAWRSGSQRRTGTREESKAHMDNFLQYICENGERCPSCLCTFIEFGPPSYKFRWEWR